jgi:hypothetical protein
MPKRHPNSIARFAEEILVTDHSTDTFRFADSVFGEAQLGDQRRTRRLVTLTDQICRHPGGSLPQKLHAPKDLKALYRLCDTKDVTHQAIIQSARQATLRKIREHPDDVLILHDATELDYTTQTALGPQLGQIGKGNRKGYICHNSLAVDPRTREVLGLTGQILHHRVKAPKRESQQQRRERESRESRLWLQGAQDLPADRRLVDVCDQGADTFEFLEAESQSGRRFVIRSKYSRKIQVGHDPTAAFDRLREYICGLPAIGGRVADLQPHPKRKKRRARLLVSAAPVLVHRPHAKAGNHGNEPLKMWGVRVWEVHTPRGEKPVEWFLLTNEPITTLEDAIRVITWYQLRWIIEEYHKAMKTGCSMEQLQFRTIDRLEPMVGVLSVVATTLLNLRAAAEHPQAKTQKATKLFSSEYVEVLSAWRWGRVRRNTTIYDFFFALARLGGHQNRKSDKRPGWLILWRGWTLLQAMVDGAEVIQSKKCG